MQVVYLSNYFNHHQKPFSDAMYQRIGEGYCFVETTDLPAFRRRLGYKEIKAPYVIKYTDTSKEYLDRKIMYADVVIFGEAPLFLIKNRIRARKMTFRDDESRYKNPNRYLKWPIYTYNSLFLNRCFLLCASAYAPFDYLLSGMNPNKCFRWGYFTELKEYNIEKLMRVKEKHYPCVSLLWVGRLIELKHPEASIYVAEKLKEQGFKFQLNIIGSGHLEPKLKAIVQNKGLCNEIHFLGAMDQSEVREYMEKSDVFLFTSDRREGWGAVLNESMNSGCSVVAGSNIGSVPYLIEDGKNGMVFKSNNWADLYNRVKFLVSHPDVRKNMGIKAYQTMSSLWNGENAAESFLALCGALKTGTQNPILEGPCSPAPLLMRTWKGVARTF